MTEEEYTKLQTAYGETTCRIFSTYLRTVLLHQPITVYYRNRTADEFADAAVQLKNEMNEIGRNFNQVVRKVNRASTDDEVGYYLFELRLLQGKTDEKVTEICDKMYQIYSHLASERDHLKGQKMDLENLILNQAAAADQSKKKAGQ